jgi:RNA polymerase sigma-70 factor (ECF subfamily)
VKTEAALLTATAEGDDQAFAALVARHAAAAQQLAYRFLQNHQDAEEVVQDSFLKVYHHARDFNPERAQFRTWFYQIMLRTIFDKRRRKVLPISYAEQEDDFGSDQNDHPEQIYAKQAQRQDIAQAIACLNKKQRAVILLYYFSECSQLEIAEILQIHPKAVEGLLHRAKEKLRSLLPDTPH